MHVFYEPIRNFYDLEGLWIDAKKIKTPSLINAPDQNLKLDA
jgi:ribosome-associated protein